MGLLEPAPTIGATPVEARGIVEQMWLVHYGLTEFLSQRIWDLEQIKVKSLSFEVVSTEQ